MCSMRTHVQQWNLCGVIKTHYICLIKVWCNRRCAKHLINFYIPKSGGSILGKQLRLKRDVDDSRRVPIDRWKPFTSFEKCVKFLTTIRLV